TGAGKHINPQLTFAKDNGIELKVGDPANEVPGESIILPVNAGLIRVKDLDLDHMRRSLIRNQTAGAKATGISRVDIEYLMAETRSDEGFVRRVLQELEVPVREE